MVTLLLLVLVAGQAQAGIALVASSSTQQTRVLAPLVTFAPGTAGTTTLGKNWTSAVTSKASSNSVDDLLHVHLNATGTQLVKVTLVGATNLSDLRVVTVTLNGVTQVSITSGIIVQSTGPQAPLAAGADLLVAGTFRTRSSAASTLTFVVSSQRTATSPVAEESWTVNVA